LEGQIRLPGHARDRYDSGYLVKEDMVVVAALGIGRSVDPRADEL
jgi:hypothetical protein